MLSYTSARHGFKNHRRFGSSHTQLLRLFCLIQVRFETLKKGERWFLGQLKQVAPRHTVMEKTTSLTKLEDLKDLNDLPASQREKLLRASWMYHDYMWFQSAIGAVGPEMANTGNQRAIFETGKAEMTRLMRAMRIYPVHSMENVVKLILSAYELYIGEMVKMGMDHGQDWLRFYALACFAQKGTQKDGLGAIYYCGALKRISGWLEAMGLEYVVEPEIGPCLVSQNKNCSFLVRLKAEWL